MDERARFGTPDLTVFSGLEALTLENLYEELPWWRAQIIQVLKNSSDLQELRLSLSPKTLARYDALEELPKFDAFFDELCFDYGDAVPEPLRLRSLNCGTAVHPFEFGGLTTLTDLEYLEEIHLENRGVWEGSLIVPMYDGDESGCLLALDVLCAPNLRRVSFANYQRDIHEYFADLGGFDDELMRPLAITCQRQCWGYELAALLRPDPKFPCLPMHPRMIDIDLQRSQVDLLDDDGDDLEDIPTAKEVLADLVSGDEGTLEGLTVHLGEDPEAEGGFEDFGLLVDALGKLANLTQLAVLANFDSECLLSGDALEKAARLLAAAAPQLRYVKVYDKCWRVCRGGDDPVQLEELEAREVEDVELFRALIWKPSPC